MDLSRLDVASTWMDLGGTEITDSDLVHLQRFKALERLMLAGTDITDAGLEHHRRFPASDAWPQCNTPSGPTKGS